MEPLLWEGRAWARVPEEPVCGPWPRLSAWICVHEEGLRCWRHLTESHSTLGWLSWTCLSPGSLPQRCVYYMDVAPAWCPAPLPHLSHGSLFQIHVALAYRWSTQAEAPLCSILSPVSLTFLSCFKDSVTNHLNACFSPFSFFSVFPFPGFGYISDSYFWIKTLAFLNWQTAQYTYFPYKGISTQNCLLTKE